MRAWSILDLVHFDSMPANITSCKIHSSCLEVKLVVYRIIMIHLEMERYDNAVWVSNKGQLSRNILDLK